MAAEIPEEVVCTFEGVDDVTPTIMHLGRSFVLLGANIGFIAKALGIHNAALDQAVQGFLLVGHVMRAANAALVIYTTIKKVAIGLETAHIASMAAEAGSLDMITANLLGVTAAQTGYNISKMIALALEGPRGWAILGGAMIVAGAAGAAFGYGAAGGFSGGGHTPSEQTNITVHVANMSVKKDVEETMEEAGTVWNRLRRTYRRPGGH